MEASWNKGFWKKGLFDQIYLFWRKRHELSS